MLQLLEYAQSPAAASLLVRFAIDIAAMSLLIFGMYYRRYRDKEIVTAASLFNVFVFAVLTVLSAIEFSVAAGFGLFAILALFTLRSEPISKIEMPYFFGSVAIAVITAVQGTSIPMVTCIVLFVLAGAYLMDHPRLLRSVDGIKITLDKIDHNALSDQIAMKETLSRKLGVEVTHYQITQLDYVSELARITVFFRKPSPQQPTTLNGTAIRASAETPAALAAPALPR